MRGFEYDDDPSTDPWEEVWVVVTVEDSSGMEWEFTSELLNGVLADILLRELGNEGTRITKGHKKRKEKPDGE